MQLFVGQGGERETHSAKKTHRGDWEQDVSQRKSFIFETKNHECHMPNAEPKRPNRQFCSGSQYRHTTNWFPVVKLWRPCPEFLRWKIKQVVERNTSSEAGLRRVFFHRRVPFFYVCRIVASSRRQTLILIDEVSALFVRERIKSTTGALERGRY